MKTHRDLALKLKRELKEGQEKAASYEAQIEDLGAQIQVGRGGVGRRRRRWRCFTARFCWQQ